MVRRQAVRAIVIKDQSVLVMKRNKFGRAYYTLVGGGMEMGEQPEQTLRRELQEEAGLNVGAVRPIFIEDGGDMYGLQYIYLCEYQGGEIQLADYTVEAQLNKAGQNTYETMWLPIDQLMQVPFRSSSVRDAMLDGIKNGFPETPQELAWRPKVWQNKTYVKEGIGVMARLHERLFAGFGAFLFLASASALTIFVVMNPGSDTTATDAAAQKTCTAKQTEETLSAPDVYKTTDPVTELRTTDLTEGSGPAAKDGDCLVMKYYGTLATDGTVFDQNFSDTTAFAFTLGKHAVIEGWDTGLVGMKAGGMRQLVIPAVQAYGSQANGAIPANSDLVFVVKLLRIQK